MANRKTHMQKKVTATFIQQHPQTGKAGFQGTQSLGEVLGITMTPYLIGEKAKQGSKGRSPLAGCGVSPHIPFSLGWGGELAKNNNLMR
jgi:hypothetical protein